MEKICQTASSNRVVWLDFLKVIAVFMMLAVHCTDKVTPAERFEPWYNVWGILYGSLLRPAIPLFVMVTGALLLSVRQDARSFYGKRLMRIVIPFVFWSVLYNLFPWFMGGRFGPVGNPLLFCVGGSFSEFGRCFVSHCDDSVYFFSFCHPDVVCVCTYRALSLHVGIFGLGQ